MARHSVSRLEVDPYRMYCLRRRLDISDAAPGRLVSPPPGPTDDGEQDYSQSPRMDPTFRRIVKKRVLRSQNVDESDVDFMSESPSPLPNKRARPDAVRTPPPGPTEDDEHESPMSPLLELAPKHIVEPAVEDDTSTQDLVSV